jgi:hypothetical protein
VNLVDTKNFESSIHLLRLDALIFKQMRDKNLTYMEGPSILHRFQEMIMTTSGETDKLPNDILQLTNELKTTSEKTFFAYSLPGFGIVICGFPS